MQQQTRQRYPEFYRSGFARRLVYLPGAAILVYGAWLALTI